MFSQFTWEPPILAWLHLFPLLGYAAAASRRGMTLTMPLCDRHYAPRRRAERIGLLFFLGAPVFGLIVGWHLEDWEWGLSVTGSFVLAAIVAAFFTRNPLRVKKISGTHGWFKGAGEAFLMRLPMAPPEV
jgi:hypothetical protein